MASAHFTRKGFEAVSVRDIAAEAGVTRALVFHYFPGKDSLLNAVLRREGEALLAGTAPDPALSRRANLDPNGETWRGFAAAKELTDIAPGIILVSLPGHPRPRLRRRRRRPQVDTARR